MRASTDERCRIQSRDLFKPNTRYEGQIEPDGSIRLVELVEKRAPRARLVRRTGRTYLETDQVITDEDVRQAMEAFP